MLDQIKVLDENNISFDIVNGVIKVFDQNDQLVGEESLPIPVEEGMDIETIYSVAESYGYNVNEMIENIIADAVMERRDYDLWLTEENMIFFSPSAGQFVAEPYIGLFAAIGQYFEDRMYYDNEEDFEDHEEEYLEEVEDSDFQHQYDDQEDDFSEEDEEEYDFDHEDVEDTTSDDDFDDEEIDFPVNEVEDEYIKEDYEETQFNETEEDLEEPEFEEEVEEEDEFTKALNERLSKKGKFQDEIGEDEVKEETEPVVEEEVVVEETNQSEHVVVTTENEDLIKSWKEAYMYSLKTRNNVEGVSLSDLRDQVLEIILEKNVSVFDVNENDILFELVERAPVVFDTKNAIRAGLYQTYLMQKDEL